MLVLVLVLMLMFMLVLVFVTDVSVGVVTCCRHEKETITNESVGRLRLIMQKIGRL